MKFAPLIFIFPLLVCSLYSQQNLYDKENPTRHFYKDFIAQSVGIIQREKEQACMVIAEDLPSIQKQPYLWHLLNMIIPYNREIYSLAEQLTDQTKLILITGNTYRGVYDPEKAFNYHLGVMVIPLICISFIFLIFMSCCCSCCNCCCLISRSLRSPRYRKIKKGLMTFGLANMIGLMALLALSIPEIDRCTESMDKAYCLSLDFIEEILIGGPQSKWIGIEKALEQLEKFKSIRIQEPTLQQLVNSKEDLKESLLTYHSKLEKIYKQNKEIYLADPNNKEKTYHSDYFQDFGPISKKSSKLGKIDSKFEQVAESAEEITTQIGILQSILYRYQQPSHNLFRTINRYIESINLMNPFIYQEDSFREPHMSRIKTWINYVLLYLFFISFALSITAIGRILKGKDYFKFFSQTTFFMTCLASIILFMMICFSTMVELQFSDTIRDINHFDSTDTRAFLEQLYNQFLKFYDPFRSFYPIVELAQDASEVCIFGDGDIHGFSDPEIISTFTTPIDKLQEQKSKIDHFIRGINSPQNTILGKEITTLHQILSHQQYLDAYQTHAMAFINKLSNKDDPNSIQNCEKVSDHWYLNSKQCQKSFESHSIFQESDFPDYQLGYEICMGFDLWFDKNISQRYSGQFEGCTDLEGRAFDETLIERVESMIVHLKDVEDKFSGLLGDLRKYRDELKKLEPQLVNFVEAIDSIMEEPLEIYSQLNHQTEGIVENFNCRFVRKYLKKGAEHVLEQEDPIRLQLIAIFFYVATLLFVGSTMVYIATKNWIEEDMMPNQVDQGRRDE